MLWGFHSLLNVYEYRYNLDFRFDRSDAEITSETWTILKFENKLIGLQKWQNMVVLQSVKADWVECGKGKHILSNLYSIQNPLSLDKTKNN